MVLELYFRGTVFSPREVIFSKLFYCSSRRQQKLSKNVVFRGFQTTRYPIDEIPLFSNYSPCFHKIGYIQKIVYKKINYSVKSMIGKSVYFYKIGRFFPGQGGRSLVESRSDFRPLFAGVGRRLVKVWRLIFATPPAFPRIGVVLWSDFGRSLAPDRNYRFPRK